MTDFITSISHNMKIYLYVAQSELLTDINKVVSQFPAELPIKLEFNASSLTTKAAEKLVNLFRLNITDLHITNELYTSPNSLINLRYLLYY